MSFLFQSQCLIDTVYCIWNFVWWMDFYCPRHLALPCPISFNSAVDPPPVPKLYDNFDFARCCILLHLWFNTRASVNALKSIAHEVLTFLVVVHQISQDHPLKFLQKDFFHSNCFLFFISGIPLWDSRILFPLMKSTIFSSILSKFTSQGNCCCFIVADAPYFGHTFLVVNLWASTFQWLMYSYLPTVFKLSFSSIKCLMPQNTHGWFYVSN